MSDEYQTDINLKTLELELKLVMSTYDNWYDIYNDNIKRKNYDVSKKTLYELNRTNDMIMKLVENIKLVLKNTNNYSGITLENLNQIADKYRSHKLTLESIEVESNNIDGKVDISQQTKNTQYIQYIIIIVVGGIVMALTAKTMLTKNDTALDIAVLVIITGISLYFLITNIIIQ